MFQAPAHHTLNIGDRTVHGGKVFTVEDEERALELLTQPGLTVIEATPVEIVLDLANSAQDPQTLAEGLVHLESVGQRGSELLAALSAAAHEGLSRTALDSLAREQGIEEPERLPNKAAVIAALNPPEADTGEGQHPEKEG